MEGLRHGGVCGYVLVSVLSPCPHSCGVLICVSWFYTAPYLMLLPCFSMFILSCTLYCMVTSSCLYAGFHTGIFSGGGGGTL